MKKNISLYDAEFCALDLETSSINPFTGKIIEIGIIKFKLNSQIKEFSTLINPKLKIPEDVIKIHGITDEMVKDSPYFEDIIDKVSSFLEGIPLVIHNPQFDMAFIQMEYYRSGKKFPFLEAYDTVSLSRKTFNQLNNYKLNTICDYLNITLNHHRALSDAYGCMQIFRNIIKRQDKRKNWTFTELNNIHGNIEKSEYIKELDKKFCRGGEIKKGKICLIQYCDSQGQLTERKILPKKIYQRGKQTVIIAHCYLRKEERFFKAKRINKID